MEFRKLLIWICVAAAMVGCATPYQSGKGSLTGGFGEKKISDSAYYVYFSGNGYATKERVHVFWLYRCAELTVQKGFDLMVIRTGESTSDASPPVNSAIRPVSINANREYAVKPAVWHPDTDPSVKTQNAAYYYYTTTSTVTTWSSKGTVLMYRYPLPDELVWAIDAKKFMAQFKSYVDSNGSTPAPSDAEAAMNAFVAHESVTLPEGNLSLAVSKTSDTLPLRDSGEILKRVRDTQVQLHTSFRERKRLEGTTSGGTVVLGFTITPNGPVSECHVVSTTFKEKEFVEMIRQTVMKASFSPKSAAATTVTSFSISFAPLVSESI